jgi:soluble lytic murein transglycosylase
MGQDNPDIDPQAIASESSPPLASPDALSQANSDRPLTTPEPTTTPPSLDATQPQTFPQRQRLLWGLGGAMLIGGGAVLGTLAWLKPPELPNPLPATEQAQLSAEAFDRLRRASRFNLNLQESNRARLLLARAHLDSEPELALKELAGLDTTYPLMAPWVLKYRARAYNQLGQAPQANATWRELVQRHPNSPVAAEALYALGKSNPANWQTALQRFPRAPISVEIAQQLVDQQPNSPKAKDWLLHIARHGLYRLNLDEVIDQLRTRYKSRLTPAEWQVVGDAAWKRDRYDIAAQAYSQAPADARTAYRTARAFDLSDQPEAARQRYAAFLKRYPQTEDTPRALLHLARLSPDPQQQLSLLDQVIQRFPEQAPTALARKAEILAKRDPSAAQQARAELLQRYPDSEAAAEWRWQQAWTAAQQGDRPTALRQVEAIQRQAPETMLAPRAAFWQGRWQSQDGQVAAAQAQFQQVLERYPRSYYAWRAAVQLGQPVGDFIELRDRQPQLDKAAQPRRALPVGSPQLQELYRLGLDREAWTLWQSEFDRPEQPTPAERFTDGVIQMGLGDYLDGMAQMERLKTETDPKAQTLVQRPDFWHELYPFPYEGEVAQLSAEAKVNPLLVTALMRQESRFMPGIQSVVGATGLMQLMPETAAEVARELGLKQYDLTNPADNIRLGTSYLAHTHNLWDNNSLLAIASYNAGPGAVADWVKRFSLDDLDTFVEQIPYPETRNYIETVFGNYWNYLQLYGLGAAG